jgi:SAM-dependent methyltransferase
MDGTAVSQYFDATSDVYTTETEIDEMDSPPLVDEFIDRHCTEGDRLLEIGCGDGNLLEYALEYTDISEAYGLDISGEMLPDPEDESRARYIHASATDLPLPFERETFDFVVMSDVLHHLVGSHRWESKRYAQATLVEATNLLRPGGYLVLKDIFYESPVGPNTLTSHLIFFGLRHLSGVASRIDAEALPGLLVAFYTRDELLELVRRSGTEIVDQSIERR